VGIRADDDCWTNFNIATNEDRGVVEDEDTRNNMLEQSERRRESIWLLPSIEVALLADEDVEAPIDIERSSYVGSVTVFTHQSLASSIAAIF